MTSKPKARSQYEMYQAAAHKLCDELLKSGHQEAHAMAASWRSFLVRAEEGLSDPEAGLTRSKIRSGLKQGLRECPQIFSGYPVEARDLLLVAWRKIMSAEVPEFFANEEQQLQKLVTKGRLRTENEYYLVRYRIDELKVVSSTPSVDLRALYELLGTYRIDVKSPRHPP